MKHKILTVCIPSWNRAPKLRRLLPLLTAQVAAHGLEDDVDIVVGNNGSTDATVEVCAQLGVRVTSRPTNVGFDTNTFALFEEARTDYVLFFSDDDIPNNDLLPVVVNLLRTQEPALMLYGFVQPPFSEDHFTLPGRAARELVTEWAQALKMITVFPKLSVYCVRRKDMTSHQLTDIRRIGADTGYIFVTLAAMSFANAPDKGLLLHRAPLARADDEVFIDFRFSPRVYARLGRAVSIGPVLEHCAMELRRFSSDELDAAMSGLLRQRLGFITFAPDVSNETKRYVKEHVTSLWRPKYLKYLACWAAFEVASAFRCEDRFRDMIVHIGTWLRERQRATP